ncbi:MAG: type II secretion system minor pseudopilin GspI [Thiohalophilus sp.]
MAGGAQRGFTLMEVLVAVAVLAIALAAAIRVGSQTAINTVELRERTYAGWVADNVLARIDAGIEPLSGAGERRGKTEQGDQAWEWQLTAEEARPPLPGEIKLPGLLRLEVAVYRADAGERRPVVVRELWHSLPRTETTGSEETTQ